MAYPLIILGAGASYDYLDQSNLPRKFLQGDDFERFRAPLANQLFDNRRFDDVIDRRSGLFSSLVSEVSARIGENAGFEIVLTDLLDNSAPRNPNIYKELVSLIFYLSDLFQTISVRYYHKRNNYRVLFQNIDSFCGRAACFVNFNYDLILEKAIEDHYSIPLGSDQTDIHTLVMSELKVIKIHGACNWFYNPTPVTSKDKYPTSEDFFVANAEDTIKKGGGASDIFPIPAPPSTKNSFNIEPSPELGSWVANLPALALPLKGKRGFVCPKSHIETLKGCMPKVDRILIVGWRGEDESLVALLSSELDPKVPITVVGGAGDETEVLKNLESLHNNTRVTYYKGGFSQFVRSDNCREFFA